MRDETTAAVVGAILVIVVVVVTALCIGFKSVNSMENYWQSQAVRHNAGYWEVRENGTTFFKWNTGENPE